MPKIKNLSSKFKKLVPAFKELDLNADIGETGQKGGFSVFSNIFSRGQGEAVFSITRSGISATTVGSQKSKSNFKKIQEAIDWTNSQGGGFIYIPAGTYIIDSNLTLYSNISLVGENSQNTIFDFNGSSNNISIIGDSLTPITNVNITNIKFANCTITPGSGVIHIKDAEDIVITRNFFDSNDYTGGFDDVGDIYLGDGVGQNRIEISNNYGENGHTFLYISSMGDSVIRDNVIESYSNYAIHFLAMVASISGNFFSSISDTAIYGEDPFSGVIINNYIDQAGVNGISCATLEWAIVNSNWIGGTGSGDYGIEIGPSSNSTISSNVVYNFGKDGIIISTSDEMIIIGNQVHSSGGYGINISNSSSENNLIANNMLSGNTSGGINDSGTSTTTDANVTI